MSHFAGVIERFRVAVAGPPDEVPAARAALLVALAEHPALDVDAYEAQVQEWVRALEARIHPAAEPGARLDAAVELFFSELGFRGDEETYADPENLLLDRVIERRRGIPVTLALLFVEVCQGAGIEMRGVGLPGHVICRMETEDGPLFIDVFRRGARLSEDDCRRIVRSIYGRRTPFAEHFLEPVTPRQLIQRLLHNLKAGALRRGDEEQAERAIELILTLAPWDLDEIRDRGRLRERLGDYDAALPDLEAYLRFRPDARDAQSIADAVRSLRRHTSA